MIERFSAIAKRVADITGHPVTFSVAVMFVVAWVIGGLISGFTSYYLESFITGMEIIAVLLLLLLQRATNVSDESLQLKLNELLRAIEGRDASRLDIEDQSDADRADARQRDRHTAQEES